jgi:hypothetical protein
MFSGEYFCKLDEKGRFLLPSASVIFCALTGKPGKKASSS